MAWFDLLGAFVGVRSRIVIAGVLAVVATGMTAQWWIERNRRLAVTPTLIAALPAPLPGWTATPPETESFGDGYAIVAAYRGGAPGERLSIVVRVESGRLASTRASATGAAPTRETIAGQSVLFPEPGAGTSLAFSGIDGRFAVRVAATTLDERIGRDARRAAIAAHLERIDWPRLHEFATRLAAAP